MTIWLAEESAAVIASLAEDLAPKAATILELGCGDGRLAARLLKAFPGASWKGYEQDPGLAEKAAARFEFMGSGMSIVEQDFTTASLGNGFDLAVCSAALLGMQAELKDRVFARVHRALSSSGAFLFLDAVRPPSKGIAEAYRAREREELSTKGLRRETVLAEMEEDSHRTGLWSVEEELYRLRKAAFIEVDLAWKNRDRAVFACLK